MYDDTASAPRMTFMALTKNSPATRASWTSRPKLHIPSVGTSTIAGSLPRMGGELGVAYAA